MAHGLWPRLCRSRLGNSFLQWKECSCIWQRSSRRRNNNHHGNGSPSVPMYWISFGTHHTTISRSSWTRRSNRAIIFGKRLEIRHGRLHGCVASSTWWLHSGHNWMRIGHGIYPKSSWKNGIPRLPSPKAFAPVTCTLTIKWRLCPRTPRMIATWRWITLSMSNPCFQKRLSSTWMIFVSDCVFSCSPSTTTMRPSLKWSSRSCIALFGRCAHQRCLLKLATESGGDGKGMEDYLERSLLGESESATLDCGVFLDRSEFRKSGEFA